MARFIDHKPWVPVIGEFMVAFGSIESSVNELLRNVCSEAVMKVVITLQLSARIKLLKEALVDWKYLSDPNKEVLRLNLDEVVGLSRTRNLIAHNPLVFSAFQDEDGEPNGRFNIWSEQTEKTISLPELQKDTDRAVRISDALSSNWIDYDMAFMRGEQPVMKRPS